jgi:hypothetical protein
MVVAKFFYAAGFTTMHWAKIVGEGICMYSLFNIVVYGDVYVYVYVGRL